MILFNRQNSGVPRGYRLFLPMTMVIIVTALQSVGTGQTDAPNIIVILSDDMGFSDIQPYGGEIETPTLQRLADNGLRFTQFYNTARCCPTRASLLTGLYPHQAGVGWMMTDRGYEGYRGDLNQSCQTIAEVLRPAGYRTYMAGKWHVTPHVLPGESQHNWPIQRGFDRFYGTIHGAGSFFDPNALVRQNTLISPTADPEYQPDVYYYTDAISDHCVRFIEDHCAQDESADKPFFMYVAYTAAHWPMHALPEDIAKYQGRYDAGYAAIREARLKRARELGLVSPDCELSPHAEDWSKVEHTDWEIACMEVYAAMVDRMDAGIGKIVSSLDQNSQLENTLIFFMQDNGGCAEGLGRNLNRELVKRAPTATLPPMQAEDLQLDMIPKQTRAGYPILQGPGVMPGPADTYIAYGRGWANVSNTPFREYKHWVHEGGISTPLIAHWPRGIRRRGELDHQPGHLIDIMATCVDVSGAAYPTQVDGKSIKPLEGRSLQPAFGGKKIERDAIYWEHEGNRAIRVGDWKLVAKENRPWELYNIAEDRAELHDLASQFPERVRSLEKKWDDWAARADVLPLGGWRGDSKHHQLSLNTDTRFELMQGDDLPRSSSPAVAGMPFQIAVKITEPADEGVLIAHGGSSQGYTLFLKQGKLHFTLTVDGQRWTLASEAPVTTASELQVRIKKNRQVTLLADGKQVAAGKALRMLEKMPQDGLQVGLDTQGQVGDYEGGFPFAGKLGSVILTVGDQDKSSK